MSLRIIQEYLQPKIGGKNKNIQPGSGKQSSYKKKSVYREKAVYIKTHKTAINRPVDHTGET